MNSLTIVVVDANPDVAAAIADVLATYGCHVVSASTADDAARIISGGSLSALVVDVHDWRVDGRRLVESIRARDSQIPIVLTAPAAVDVSALMSSPSKTTLLVKPFDSEALSKAIRNLL